ncbi:sensor histidine kinase [Hymenobacter sp. BT559]|uniref:sensor histidine kinase n=1 Tax=Hymenobacter sp. BT559 TaxID=2795729 RepID=UPI0018ED98B7|nr:histidine kinase [Hymenobacter sp. BT559]MBJ6141942.1 histidine kinase [Hymenobacter sp. BT559]
MPRLSFSLKPVLTHLAVWVSFGIYEQSTQFFINPYRLSFFWILLNYGLNALLFYSNSDWLLPRLVGRRHYVRYAIFTLVLTSVYALCRAQIGLSAVASPVPFTFGQQWVASLYRGSFFLFVSTGYWFARRAVQLERHKREQEQQLRLAEKNLFEANLAFLKSQINPHFLFNSLNFLYAQVYPHSEPAAQGILLLADTMRYALHENTAGKVPLSQEVQHLHNYIAMNQLRYHQQLQVQFEVTGNDQFVLILPLVLITFVENCFKHGELADPAHPLRIELAVEPGRLTFQTHNRKRHGPKENRAGIGLANTRSRLELVYPGRHSLTITDAPDAYTCHLTLDL